MADRKITLNKTFTVDLAGDSIWDKERTINPKSVEVTGITLRESDYGDECDTQASALCDED